MMRISICVYLELVEPLRVYALQQREHDPRGREMQYYALSFISLHPPRQ